MGFEQAGPGEGCILTRSNVWEAMRDDSDLLSISFFLRASGRQDGTLAPTRARETSSPHTDFGEKGLFASLGRVHCEKAFLHG